MAVRKWITKRDGDTVTLARRFPVRFDVAADTTGPVVGRAWLATLIRQDMWRALQGVRGFSPEVEITRDRDQLLIRAGGRIDGIVPVVAINVRIETLLNDPQKRARWFAKAKTAVKS